MNNFNMKDFANLNEFIEHYRAEAEAINLAEAVPLVYNILSFQKLKSNRDEVAIFCKNGLSEVEIRLINTLIRQPYKYPKQGKDFLIDIKVHLEYLDLYKKATLNQPPQPKAVKKQFTDFFVENTKTEIIEDIQAAFKDLIGKKMAFLVYLLHKEYGLINYSLKNTETSRKHFVAALKGVEAPMQGINKCFELNDVNIKDPKFKQDNDYTTIKNQLNNIVQRKN